MSVIPFRPQAALAVALTAAALVFVPAAFAAPADSTNTPPMPIELRVSPTSPCANDTVRLEAYNPCYPCYEITSFGRTQEGRIQLVFDQRSGAACGEIPCGLQIRGFLLGRFMAGHYDVLVDVVWNTPPDSTSSGGVRMFQQRVTFDVTTCGQNTLPFVNHVFIGAIPPCDNCPPVVCPGEPVRIGLTGTLPNQCWSVRGFEVLPLASPINGPVARLTLSEACGDSANCPPNPLPFSVATSLPPQQPGSQHVSIEVAVIGCADSTALRIASQTFPYIVQDSCPPPPPPAACVYPFLLPANRVSNDTIPVSPCDLRLQPGGHGSIVFASRSQNVALAGLQGSFGASPFLHIVNIEPVGFAANMHLDWTKKENGASYVLYSGGGIKIPADQWAGVLRVTVQADSGPAQSLPGYVYGSVTAASDSIGTAVGICPIRELNIVAPGARVCVLEAASCDANGDGVSNVADLVRMVFCLRHPEACPDTIAAQPDCNQDGAFHLDDVYCCAHGILGGPNPGPGRPPGSLSFSFGTPVVNGSMVTVPLRVRGARDVAGALLRIDYPSDRWIAIPSLSGGGPASATGSADNWAPLVELGESDVMVGVLRLDDTAPTDLTVNLAFSLRPGAEPGGELRVGSSDVTASDGTPIDIDLASLSQTLDVGPGGTSASVSLSSARPNPSSGATSFVVSLPAAGNVDLGMFDLAGRRVATLHRGMLAAGERTFTWQPGDVPSGVYFARLSVDGTVRSSRVTLKVAR